MQLCALGIDFYTKMANYSVDMDIEKYQFLFEHAKYVYDEDVKRIARIDNKASRYLSVIMIILGLSIAYGSWFINNLFPLQSLINIVTFIFILAYYILLSLSLLYSFLVLRLETIPIVVMNDNMLKAIVSKDYVKSLYNLAIRFKEAHIELHERIRKKGHFLACSYKFLIAFFIIVAILIALNISRYKVKDKAKAAVIEKSAIFLKPHEI